MYNKIINNIIIIYNNITIINITNIAVLFEI
jgi:hypothetical protein